MYIINHIRTIYGNDFTQSQLYLPILTHEPFCYVLEDEARPVDVKLYGKTCLPRGVYRVSLQYSPRFKRDMLTLTSCNSSLSFKLDDLAGTCNYGGKTFTGVRVHGGNDVEDTLGCPLVAFHTDNAGKVWGSAERRLVEIISPKLKQDITVLWVIS